MVRMPHWPIYTGMVKSISNINVIRVLEILGNPHLGLKNVIHIGGTNGKGSTVAYCSQILKEAGLSVNKYISPHLLECNERINIKGSDIGDDDLFFYIEKIRMVCERARIDLTMFEATTIACFLAFADSKADWNVIEVGMGGLNDATNVFDSSNLRLCVLTPVSFDHKDFLGDDLYLIALQKTAIFRRNIPCVVSSQPREALAGIVDLSNKMNVRPLIFGYDFSVSKLVENDEDAGFCVHFKKQNFNYSLPNLLGDHQLINATTSIVGMKQIMPDLSDGVINQGVQKANIKGRLERVMEVRFLRILETGSEIYFDGAHNPAGAFVLSRYIQKMKAKDTDFAYFVVIGRSKNTDSAAFAVHFKNLVDGVYSVRVNGEIKPETAELIASQICSVGINCLPVKNLDTAIDEIAQKKLKCRVFICGSLYLARDIKIANIN